MLSHYFIQKLKEHTCLSVQSHKHLTALCTGKQATRQCIQGDFKLLFNSSPTHNTPVYWTLETYLSACPYYRILRSASQRWIYISERGDADKLGIPSAWPEKDHSGSTHRRLEAYPQFHSEDVLIIGKMEVANSSLQLTRPRRKFL